MDAAVASGVSQGVISGIERGENTTLETMRKLIAAYDVGEAEAGAVLVAP